jgi:hypothetical protein
VTLRFSRLPAAPLGYLQAMTEHPEERDDDVGAENEGSEDENALPAQPADDDASLGDTDQHSEAQDA